MVDPSIKAFPGTLDIIPAALYRTPLNLDKSILDLFHAAKIPLGCTHPLLSLVSSAAVATGQP